MEKKRLSQAADCVLAVAVVCSFIGVSLLVSEILITIQKL